MTRLIKVCGIKTEAACAKAIDSGASLVGIILVPGRKRTIHEDVALKLSNMIRERRKAKGSKLLSVQDIVNHLKQKRFQSFEEFSLAFREAVVENGPFLVGVFRNEEMTNVFDKARKLNLDFIQLHGNEDKQAILDFNIASGVQYGIIPRYQIPKDQDAMKRDFSRVVNGSNYDGSGFAFALLDSEAGGEGKLINWQEVDNLTFGQFILAGGLNPQNVKSAFDVSRVIGVDVSGGVENEEGDKDLKKIEEFIRNGSV
ncbi:Piso0_000508 [Millerozyma farinosa CBS 7064]|uniref:N-(5'-phosphoribosyl)anthranilate isomerase n=1 Tax=Pichia sorbitophila (strain ATCC MYA-4447 / BCRC 22081 / CBS 7064 / NBRC 10061 / NRRL Y-12695) TaxID=559304 RepID=G8YU65_PICSO|nr:Piso0_000508 [Millerozyma farinosa CBS 7064]CCE73466.1 Piso0_000508 [Millerozyma farinosa CBS 7064]